MVIYKIQRHVIYEIHYIQLNVICEDYHSSNGMKIKLYDNLYPSYDDPDHKTFFHRFFFLDVAILHDFLSISNG